MQAELARREAGSTEKIVIPYTAYQYPDLPGMSIRGPSYASPRNMQIVIDAERGCMVRPKGRNQNGSK
jgi:hypothetical protein